MAETTEILWSATNTSATALEVAQAFARDHWPDAKRRVSSDGLEGQWTNATNRSQDWVYRGHFILVDGVNTYRLECDTDGRWTVTRA